MKAKHLTLAIVFLLTANLLKAQNAHFSTSGTIEFERNINMYALIKKNINKDNEVYYAPIFEQYKKTQPQFMVLKSTLDYNADKTLFTPEEAPTITNNFFSGSPMSMQCNVIFNDFATGLTTSQKKVYEEVFLVKDTTRRIKWKLTNETRTIAGYACRRANALVLDSIYVVAFYTDEIPVSSGPESFNGLPGMILGVALPHENITWFATKVTTNLNDGKPLNPPAKGKPVTAKGLKDKLLDVMKNWGDYAQMQLKAFML